ncbi:MAG TPA: DUF2892 domain-containing protein [Bacteroidota bacterium]|jgi:hypothetical protein|nr:DUF2892 domain-containing protein [Bacteroidota bacterium]
MKCNIGKTDRNIRIIIAVLIFIVGIIFQSWWGLLGLIPLLTAITGFCGLYVPFNISTVKKSEDSKKE